MANAFHDAHDDHAEGDDSAEITAPAWSVFGDLMAGLVGAFVLVFIGVLLTQVDLVNSLQAEVEKRQQEEARRMALEQALAVPLASGRVTLHNGRIGISGSVLFDFNSDQLRPEGEQLLQVLVPPLQVYLGERDEMLMVSGFTDNKPVGSANRQYQDNLELSAQRALTVTRALIAQGMPRSRVFAAAFGAEQPVASNADEKGRALNRRVEMALARAVRRRAGRCHEAARQRHRHAGLAAGGAQRPCRTGGTGRPRSRRSAPVCGWPLAGAAQRATLSRNLGASGGRAAGAAGTGPRAAERRPAQPTAPDARNPGPHGRTLAALPAPLHRPHRNPALAGAGPGTAQGAGRGQVVGPPAGQAQPRQALSDASHRRRGVLFAPRNKVARFHFSDA